MTIRHIKTFIAVCEAGSVTKAAELLHVAQPSVSQSISEMEKHYGVILFERINQRLILTGSGRALLQKAKEAAASFDEFEAVASDTQADPSVRVGATLSVGRVFIPVFLTKLNKRFPEIKPLVSVSRLSDIEESIINGSIDFAVVEGSVSSPILKREKLGEDRLAVVCGFDSPYPDSMELGELSRCPLLLREEGSASRKLLDAVFSTHGLTAQPVMVSSSNSAIIASVAAGHGIAVLPIELTAGGIKDGLLREITTEEGFRREISLIYHKNKKFSSAVKNARDLCCEMGYGLSDLQPFCGEACR